jgi:hypothetical protein
LVTTGGLGAAGGGEMPCVNPVIVDAYVDFVGVDMFALNTSVIKTVVDLVSF